MTNALADIEPSVKLKNRVNIGALFGAVLCWTLAFALMAFYFYLTTIENSKSEELVLRLINEYRIFIDFQLFMYIARVSAYALLTIFAYSALDISSNVKKIVEAKSSVKIAFFQITTVGLLAFWVVFLYSSCIEYYLLFVPGHTAGLIHFLQNIFGVLIALIAIRIVKSIFRLFRNIGQKQSKELTK